MTTPLQSNNSQSSWSLSEDWVAVVLGFATILLIVTGVVLPVPKYSWSNGQELLAKVFTAANLQALGFQFLLVLTLSITGALLLKKSFKNTLVVFPCIYLLTLFALIMAGNTHLKAINLEPVIISLCLGLFVGNVFTIPDWFTQSLSTELFVKIGLVILGTSIIFSDLLKAGALGLVQALAVVISVWYFAYWLCKKFKIDEELSLMISSAVSICGVSAAIATSGAIQGDPKKLSLVISLVLITAIPMMLIMPYLGNYMGLSQEVMGAWLGGSIDTTGAVVASGTLVGETALKISTIVKFSQNVLLGLAAFAISIYWSYRDKNGDNQKQEKPTLQIIWSRFPKFVLGFMAASLLFSFVISNEVLSGVKDSLKNIQSLWFVLAFTSIGLETRFSDLLHSNGKATMAFLMAQLFNIVVTLLIAYLLFN